MGRASNRRRERVTPVAQSEAVITIEPWPRQDDEDLNTPIRCRALWGSWSKIIEVETVLAMARALHRAAAQAEFLKALLLMDFPPQFAQDVVQLVVNEGGRNDKHQGVGGLRAAPGANSKHKTAVVLLEVEQAGLRGAVDTEEAHRMGIRWAQSAETALHDSLLHEALRDILGLDVERRNQITGYMALLHGVRHEPEEIRAAQIDGMRAEAGLPPLPRNGNES